MNTDQGIPAAELTPEQRIDRELNLFRMALAAARKAIAPDGSLNIQADAYALLSIAYSLLDLSAQMRLHRPAISIADNSNAHPHPD
jgi:hypothetical protein